MPDLMACMRRENSFRAATHGIGWARDRKSVVRNVLPGDNSEPAELCSAPSAQGLRVWREKVERASKEELVTQYNGIFKDAGVVVVTHYSGLSVPEIDDLRNQMAEVGGTVKVTKTDWSSSLSQAHQLSQSATFLPVRPLLRIRKTGRGTEGAAKFAKENDNFVIIGGIMDQTVLDANGVKNLASLPSLDELRGKLVGLLSAPATKVAGVLQAPAGQLARVVGAKAAQGDAA